MDNKKMPMKWIAILAIFILTLALFTASPVKANQHAYPLAEDQSYEEIDAYLEEQLRALNIPGASLVIVEGDQIVHMKGFGVSGPEGETPTPQTLFFICSLTKSFTALAVMQLVEDGKIELDAPVQRYLPWFTLADHPQAAAQIIVRHLLVQSSSLSDDNLGASLVKKLHHKGWLFSYTNVLREGWKKTQNEKALEDMKSSKAFCITR